jgi:hypothetical protein
MNNQPPRGNNDGSPHRQQQQRGGGNNVDENPEIVDRCFLLLPSFNQEEDGNLIVTNNSPHHLLDHQKNHQQNQQRRHSHSHSHLNQQQPYNTAHIDYRIAQAWISSATSMTRDGNGNTIANRNRNANANINSLRDNNNANNNINSGAAREQEQFVDEIIDYENVIIKNNKTHRSPLMGIRKSLFSSTLSSPLAQHRQHRQQQQRQQQQQQIEIDIQMMDIDDDALSPSTTPSVRDNCLIDLSVGNNNDDEGGINIRHAYGYKNNNNNVNLDFPIPSSSSSSSSDNDNNNNDSLNAVVAITPRATISQTSNNHFLWMKTNHDPYVPDEIIVSNDDDMADRNSVHDELLTGDGDVDVDGRHHQYHEQGDSPPGVVEDEELLFRPPTLMERRKAISHGDRVETPTNSWQSSKNALLSIRHRPSPISARTRTRSGSNSYSVPMSPASRHSKKSTKSEKYYHSYVTDPTTPQRPVPPFVVIHNKGHAIVKVTSKGTTTVSTSKSKSKSSNKDDCCNKGSNNNEGDKCECSPKSWCHQWGRSVAIALTVATLILALVTVVSSIIANQQENDQQKQQHEQNQQQQQQQQTHPTIPPSNADTNTIIPSNSFPMSSPANNNNNSNNNELLLSVDADDDLNDDADNAVDMLNDVIFDGTIMKLPYEETQNPASATNNSQPTPVLRTYPPNYLVPTVTPTIVLPPSMRRPPTMTITTSAPTQQQQLQELQFLPTNFPVSVPTDLPFLIDDENDDDDDFTFDVENDDNDDDNNDNNASDDELESIQWNNYVIGLLSIESPDTFIQLDDRSSPQFKALQWISVDSARKGGSIAYTMDASLQRYALATLYFALGGNENGNSNAAGLSSTPSSSSSSSLWTNDDAWLSTVVNVCDWYGITCDSSETAVLGIDMTSNGLQGTLPIELKLLKYLQNVTLPNNSISGTLPPEYSELNELVELNLANNIIEGEFPWEYGGFGSGLDMLKILDLHGNKLDGIIPSTIGNMLNLEYVNLCSNSLEGTIPSTIGSLFYLQLLKLENNNKLYGNVPDEICDMGSGSITNLLGDSNNDEGSSVSVLLVLPDIIVDCTIECNCCDQCCNGGCGDGDGSGSDGYSNDDDA